jgi:hypothetical protein
VAEITQELMGRLTQFLDYMNRIGRELTPDFKITHYTHIELTGKLRRLRRREKWYKKPS